MMRFSAILALWLALADQVLAVAPFVDPLYGVQETSNIVYGSGLVNNGASSTSLDLDLYQPTFQGFPLPAESPAIVLIHGGGFIDGDKTDLTQLADEYASLGYVVASINYRLYGDLPPNSSPGPADNFTPAPAGYDTFPDLQLGGNAINAAVQDAQAAMAWVRNNAATYDINPARIAIGGVSAGAITSLLEAYNNPPPMAAPVAVLDFLGSMYGTQGVIQPGAPPAFIFHGDADTQVPFSGDLAVASQLTAVGVYNEFYEGQGIGHELDATVFNLMFGNETLLQHNIDFLDAHLVPEPSSFLLGAIASLAMLAVVRLRRVSCGE